MLFVYLIAALLAATTSFGAFVLLTISGVWTVSHTVGIFLLLMVTLGCAWATYALLKATYNELPYWDFFK